MKIFKLAITGSAGSGKSLVCQRLSRLGWPVFDCDRIARQVVEPGRDAYEKMVGLFGHVCVMPDGKLDRARIREIIIRSDAEREKMEAVLHPAIVKELFKKIESTAASGEKRVAVEVPLLFELDLDSQFDYCVTVAVEKALMAQRIMERDKVSNESARQMLALQMDLNEKIKRSDYVIWNNEKVDRLLDAVDKLDHSLKNRYIRY